ncbi:lysophospholipid acyltransferase family protein [Xylophilus sp.]|uniref:lysophospholipid acyltransferase family protein n=1 Tax=Xylophilus sp. TaxID=2653893 RepID=UPI0013BE6724|nr:lysophospholipid acyltransferase family protein [Xylophilus sp.]KAF1049765.1 MAG: 1-acyl-sn-glycerol-3-phosphate acyltransferase [Xylophilus sp.]
MRPRRHLIAATRLVRVLAHILHGIWIIHTRLARMSEAEHQAAVRHWARGFLHRAGITLRVAGEPPAGQAGLIVANHISWLDIPTLHAAHYCRFISKSDVKGWPLLGTLSDAAGTLYLERTSRRDAARVVQGMAERLRAGDLLAVFPEGTTGDGRTLLPFHANLLQSAIEADAPVVPVALRFADGRTGATSFAPSYTGDEVLIGSLWRTLGASSIVAVVRYGTPQRAQGRDRRAWAQDLHAEVDRLRGV